MLDSELSQEDAEQNRPYHYSKHSNSDALGNWEKHTKVIYILEIKSLYIFVCFITLIIDLIGYWIKIDGQNGLRVWSRAW